MGLSLDSPDTYPLINWIFQFCEKLENHFVERNICKTTKTGLFCKILSRSIFSQECLTEFLPDAHCIVAVSRTELGSELWYPCVFFLISWDIWKIIYYIEEVSLFKKSQFQLLLTLLMVEWRQIVKSFFPKTNYKYSLMKISILSRNFSSLAPPGDENKIIIFIF